MWSFVILSIYTLTMNKSSKMSLFEHNYSYFPSFRLKNKGFLDSELDQVAVEYEQRMKSSHVQINNGTNIQSTMIHQDVHGYNGEQCQPEPFKDPKFKALVNYLKND